MNLDVYSAWLNSELVDDATKAELRAIADNEKEQESRFYQYLTFGTAGLRGVLGAGTNRMNIYTVRHATQGLANFIRNTGEDACKRGVVVGYDSRHMSTEFARESCCVLAANGIRAYLFDELRPTPEISYAVRELNCIAGINITASHNPKEYNGYKVYWEDGAQLAPEQADAVYAEIMATDIFKDVKVLPYEKVGSLVTVLDRNFDERYIACVLDQIIDRDLIKAQSDSLTIVYTPLHGTGYRLVPEVLKRAGFRNITTVAEQMVLDGDFPTVKSPNPENKEAFTDAIRLARELNSDLIIGTDPDADRIGLVVRDTDGEYKTLTGNQTGALLLHYIITAKRHLGILPENACAIKSIVSTELAARICEQENVTLMNVLTGFKFIGEKIKEFEATGSHSYIYGFEESYGCLVGTYARDKDAVSASLLVAEVAAYYATKGMTLLQALDAIYRQYGYHKEQNIILSMSGMDGIEKTRNLMQYLRTNIAQEIGGIAVKEYRDYMAGVPGFPKSDVVYYALADNTVLVVRPSGTEPKVRVYIMVSADSQEAVTEKYAKIEAAFTAFLPL